ncbi:MAG: dynamin family protein [Paludibaculum sp.]
MAPAPKANLYFEKYQHHRSELLSLAREQLEILNQSGLTQNTADGLDPARLIASLISRLETEKLSALVIGRFNAGKSTFINALFGQVVLPASLVPTTGVLCQIQYSDDAHKRATLYPKSGGPGAEEPKPFDVRIENLQQELSAYVKIDHLGDSTATSRYRKLELFWPLELCRQGVELIDSVGLDDPDSRDAITLDFAEAADVILYCMKSQDAYSAKDKQVLSLLRSLGHESILFIITNYDNVRDSAAAGETSEDLFRRIQEQNLSPWTELRGNGIQYVDSKAALIGRNRGDRALIDSSGIESVEETLGVFLAREKGRSKLMTSLRPLRSINLDVSRRLPTQIQFWQTTTAVLEKRYRDAEGPLRLLEITRKSMVSAVEADIKDVARDCRDLADVFFLELPEKIRQWADQYEVQGSLGFPPRKSTIQPIVEEVVDHIKGRIAEETAQWNQDVLSPMAQGRKQAIEDKLEDKAREFVRNLEQIRIQIAVGGDVDKDQIAGQKEPTFLARLLGLGYTLATGDIVTGGIGMVVGPKAMLNTVILQVVAGILLVVFGLFTPAGIIAAVVASILGGNFINVLQLRKAIRKKVGDAMAEQIATSHQQLSKSVEDSIHQQLNKLRDALDNGLAKEINGLRTGVEKVLEEKRTGEADSEREIAKIRGLETRNRRLEEQFGRLLTEAEAARV